MPNHLIHIAIMSETTLDQLTEWLSWIPKTVLKTRITEYLPTLTLRNWWLFLVVFTGSSGKGDHGIPFPKSLHLHQVSCYTVMQLPVMIHFAFITEEGKKRKNPCMTEGVLMLPLYSRYEDLCRHPYGEAKRLVQFISDDRQKGSVVGNKTRRSEEKDEARLMDPAMYQDLPKGVLKYLNDHVHVNKKLGFGPYTVARETSSMYQRWRWIITFEQLTKVQNACADVIRTLGHTFFSTFADVRNSSLPLFVDNSSWLCEIRIKRSNWN